MRFPSPSPPHSDLSKIVVANSSVLEQELALLQSGSEEADRERVRAEEVLQAARMANTQVGIMLPQRAHT